MRRPMQTKLVSNSDPGELYNAIDEAMYSITNAMESMQGLAEFADAFDRLASIFDDLAPDHDMYELATEAEYTQEIAELTADYYRSVI